MPSQVKSDVGTSVHCRCSRSQQSEISGVVFLQTKGKQFVLCLVVCGKAPGLAWETEAVAASMAKQFCSGTCGRGSLSVGSKISVPTEMVPEELSLPLQAWSSNWAEEHELSSDLFTLELLVVLLWRGC